MAAGFSTGRAAGRRPASIDATAALPAERCMASSGCGGPTWRRIVPFGARCVRLGVRFPPA